MNNYTVSDLIIRIKNAALAKRKKTEISFSKMAKSILEVLKREGFVTDFKKDQGNLIIEIAYLNRLPVLNDVKIISRPSVRIYQDKKTLLKKKGLNTVIVSTSKGVMTGKEAIEKGLGGEVLFEIW